MARLSDPDRLTEVSARIAAARSLASLETRDRLQVDAEVLFDGIWNLTATAGVHLAVLREQEVA